MTISPSLAAGGGTALRAALIVAMLIVTMANSACTPSRQEMQRDVNSALPEAIARRSRWLGADDDKDRAVQEAVKALLQQPLTPDGAAEVALVRHRRVQLAYESLGLAQADLVDAGLLSNPRLALAAHFHQGSLPSQQAQPPGIAVDVEWPFLSVLFLAQRTSIAEARQNAAAARVIDEVLATAADARRAVVRHAAATEVRRLQRADVEAAEGNLVLVRENTRAGNQTPLDLAEEELAYQQALLMAADAERDATLTHEALKQALGLFGGEGDVDVVALSSLPALPVPDAAIVVDPAELEVEAIRRSYRLIAMQRDLDAAARDLGYASVRRFLPDLDVGLVADVDGSDVAVGPSVGVGLPIFNLGQGEMLRRESLLRRGAADLQRAAVALRAQARQSAVAHELNLRRSHQLTTRIIPQHLIVVDELERRLNGMLLFPSRLFAGRRGFLQARRQETEARRDAWLTRIDVEQLRQGSTPFMSPMSSMSSTAGSQANPSSSAQGHD